MKSKPAILMFIAILVISMITPDFAQSQQPNRTASSPQKEQAAILNKDYIIAKQALNKAVSERDEATIKLGLETSSVLLKKDVLQAIRQLYYQWFVPDLVAALEENQTATNKGTVTRIEQQELNKSIISALQHLTGLGFFPTENLSIEEFQGIQNKSLEWYRSYETQIQQAMQSERLMMQQEISILSKYYYLAKKALDKAILEKDKATIQLGLGKQFLSLKKEIVEEAVKFNDKSFIPDLIKALERNQGIMSGGTETVIEQNLLNKAIVSALEKLTGLQFLYFDGSLTRSSFDEFPHKDIEKILKESREWCNNQKEECKPSNDANK